MKFETVCFTQFESRDSIQRIYAHLAESEANSWRTTIRKLMMKQFIFNGGQNLECLI